MKCSKPAILMLISVLTHSSLYSMDSSQSPESWRDREICIASLLHLPEDATKDDMMNIIRTNGLNVALMSDYERISTCIHYIKLAFMYQNITQLSQQPMLTQCIVDALQNT